MLYLPSDVKLNITAVDHPNIEDIFPIDRQSKNSQFTQQAV